MLMRKLKQAVKRILPNGTAKAAMEAFREGDLRAKLAEYERFVPPGHFYSPIPDLAEVGRDAARIFHSPASFPGIDLRETEQLALLDAFAPYAADLPFPEHETADFRYYYANDFYSYGDACVYFCMLRHFRPRRVVEIGSGYTSALLLDTNDRFFNGQIQCTFIEPYPTTLNRLLRPPDRHRVHVHPSRLQDVPLSVFAALQANDICFVDSTHVSKAGSDVNRIFFEVLPTLSRGTLVHVHDVFDPFEYPREWIYEGRAWNELYLLRAFLQFNAAFHVRYFNHYLAMRHPTRVAACLPPAMKNPGGGIWLQKVA